MQEEIETGVGSIAIPFVYLKGIMDKLAPVSIINDNLVAPSRAAAVAILALKKCGGGGQPWGKDNCWGGHHGNGDS